MRQTTLAFLIVLMFLPATSQALDVDLGTQFTARFDGADTGALLGRSVAAAGDVNGDGFDDVIVGAAKGIGGYETAGAAYVLYGGTRLATLDLSTPPGRGRGFSIVGTQTQSAGIGTSVAGAGDINGDGYDDVIVGAPTAENSGRTNGGYTYVVFGAASRGGALADSPGGAITIRGAAGGDVSGTSVAGAGDVNHDGFADVMIGAPGAGNNGRAGSGSAYVLYGSASFGGLDLNTMPAARGFRIDGAVAGDAFGHAVSGAGDVNKDGFGDVMAGAPGADPFSRSGAGSTYVIYGATSQTSPELVDGPIPSRGFRVDGAAAGDQSGDAVSRAGDINRDGYADIAIGADAVGGGMFKGAAYVLFGSASPDTLELSTGLTPARGVRYGGTTLSDYVGSSVGAAGDVNADGYDDLIVGASGGGTSLGRAYVAYGSQAPGSFGIDDVTPLQGFSITGATSQDATGAAAAGAGDVNGDGRDDVIVGAPQAGPNGRSTSGSAYVVSADFLPAVAYDGHVAAVIGAPLDLAPARLSASPVATLAVSPALPAGLALDTKTGHITGAPTTAGTGTYTVTVTDPRRGTAHAAFTLSVVGATGPQGSDGAQGGTGSAGPAGPAGSTGSAGPAGSVGSVGPQGPAGAKGAAGEDGQDAKVRCKVKGAKTKPKVACTVKRSSRRRAVLSRHGRVYARGSARHLTAVRTLRPGRYVLRVGRLRISVRVT